MTDKLFRVSWRFLWNVLEREKQGDFPGSRPGERHLLEDVQALPHRRGLAAFVSRLGELNLVAPYERRVFLLGRRLAPVESYRPQLLGPAG